MSSVFRASVAALLAAGVLVACESAPKPRTERPSVDKRDRVLPKMHPALADTVGQYAIFADGAPLLVEGYGVVAQLPGTGSRDMPQSIRNILLDQLYKAGAGSYIGGTENISPERILESNQIAAVEVRGVIPAMARVGTPFDVTINCIPSSQATNLSGGLLWPAELKIVGLTADTGGDTRRIALARGPVFLSGPVEAAMSDGAATQPGNSRRALRTAKVLGGGRVAEDRPMRLQLYQPNWRMAGAIERAINSRFPGRDRCAEGQSDAIISLRVPAEYDNNPIEFLNIVKHMFLNQEAPGYSEKKAAELIKAMKDPGAPCMDLSLALQALGRSVLPDYIQPQYTNADPGVRYWCSRAGAGLRDVGGMVVLQEFAKDEKSPFRKDAVASVVEFSRGGDTVRATNSLGELLKSRNAADRIAAYEGLAAIASQAIAYHKVGEKFRLDIVKCDAPTLIYVTQRDLPCIAIIGRQADLSAGVLYISPDNALTVSVAEAAPAAAEGEGEKVVTASAMDGGAAPENGKRPQNVTLYWRSPFGDRNVELKTTTRIQDIIARVGWQPNPKAPGFNKKEEYIGASYQRIAEMLAALCKDGTLQAEFVMQKAAEEPFKTPADIVSGARPEGSTAAKNAAASQPAPAAATEPSPVGVPTELPPDGAMPADVPPVK